MLIPRNTAGAPQNGFVLSVSCYKLKPLDRSRRKTQIRGALDEDGYAFVAFFIGLVGLATMISSHRLQHIHAVGTVQLIATGMCFGVAIVVAARSRKTGS